MKSVIGLFIGFSVFFLSSYALAQEKPVELTAVVTKIPTARIMDWEGDTPEVNGAAGWQGQALSVGDEVCCLAGAGNYVIVALNRSATNLVRLEQGTCLTIDEAAGKSVDDVSQDSGEALFDLGLLEEGSTFEVETPTATVGVSGTLFRLTVGANSTKSEVLELGTANALTVEDTTTVSGPTDPDSSEAGNTYSLNDNEELTIIEDDANIGPHPLPDDRALDISRCKQDVEEKVENVKRKRGEWWWFKGKGKR